jgi:hypothetical protein
MNCQSKNHSAAQLRAITRRHFFGKSACGIGSLALASLLNDKLFAGSTVSPLLPKEPHFKPKAKRIIYMFMEGAPSQLDLFDYKPKLNELNKQPIPLDIVKGEKFAFIKGTPKILGSPWKFKKHGQSGGTV